MAHPTGALKAYLTAYNLFSTLSWSYLLLLTLRHLSSSSSSLYERAITTYTSVGPVVLYVQTTALLEVIHVLLGWVRSPLATTLMQVSSRLFLVWGITERFENFHPLYATMILSWSITEVIRYAFYACNLLSLEPKPLTYLRYTTFYVLYPLGAGSEAFLIFATVPNWGELLSSSSSSFWAVGRLVMFLIWWPGLYLMYTHMVVQRKKVLGGSSADWPKAKKLQ